MLGTVPAGVIGLLFEEPIERAFGDARMAAGMLVVTGAILLLTRYIRPVPRELTLVRAMLVGSAQALAILPGISRSGMTISAALFLGIGREEAVRYSFLLSIPVILGATLLKIAELLVDTPGVTDLFGMAAGTVAAFISGYAAIKLLVLIARGGKLDYFAWYCFAIGSAGWIYF
jgi:undecaprenyl-diphosphatase